MSTKEEKGLWLIQIMSDRSNSKPASRFQIFGSKGVRRSGHLWGWWKAEEIYDEQGHEVGEGMLE